MLTKRGLLVLACFTLASCNPARGSESSAGPNPFATAQRVEPGRSKWSGRVLERLNAGSYVYLRIERGTGPPVWVVTAEAIASDAQLVQVRALRRVEQFDSKRLGRSFSPLIFAIVTKEKS